MNSNNECVNLEAIALQMTSSLDLKEVLTTVTRGIVDELGASFARIWLLGKGDLCDQCHKASICSHREKCLICQGNSRVKSPQGATADQSQLCRSGAKLN